MREIFTVILLHFCVISFVCFIALLISSLRSLREEKKITKELFKCTVVAAFAWIILDLSFLLVVLSIYQEIINNILNAF